MASGCAVAKTRNDGPGFEQCSSTEAGGTTTPPKIRDIEDLIKSIEKGILNQLPEDFGTNLPLPQMSSSSELNPQPFMYNEYEYPKYLQDEYNNNFIVMHDTDSDSDSDDWPNEHRRIIRHFRKREYSKRYPKHRPVEGDTDPLTELNSLKDKGGNLCITGPAGSGKSTLLKIVARNLVESLHGYEKVKFVHVVYHEPFRKNIKRSAHRTLFSHNVQGEDFSDSESQSLYSFVDSHRNDVILIIDGLDTLPQDFDKIKDPGPKYDPSERYSPLVHLKMLLSGKLLGGCRVVTSSRPLAIRNFKNDPLLKNVKFVSLRGFSEADANKVLELRSPNYAKNISKTFQDKPHFLSLFKEPLFLKFLIEIWENIKNSEFVGETNVMLEIMKFLYRSEHKKGEYDKLSQVKKFAQKLLWKKQLTFDETTLMEYDLAIANFRDLSTITRDEPTTNKTNGKLPQILHRKIMIIFCHQSFHELFAAYNVLESKFSSFEMKLKKLHKPYYHKTRDFVYGLAFKEEKSEFDAPAVADIHKKREALKTSIEEKFCKSSKFDKLAIFESLAEAISEKHRFNLKTTDGVDFSGIAMSDWNMYCTGIVVSQFKTLQKLHLEYCSLEPSHMRVLQQGFCKCSNELLQILSFSLKGNKKIGKEGVAIACKIVRERNVNCFNLGSCELNVECMEELQNGLQMTKVPALVLKYNDLGKEGMDIAGEIVKTCSTEDINLTKCAKTHEEVQAFAKSANGSSIDRLTVTDDDADVVSGYGHVIRTCRVNTLVLSISAQQPNDGKGIKEYSATAKVAKLQFVTTRKSIQQFHETPASSAREQLCDLIISLLTAVDEEIVVPLSFENVLLDKLSDFLDTLYKGPKIRLCGELENIIQRGSIVTLFKKEQEGPDSLDKCEDKMSSAGENQMDTDGPASLDNCEDKMSSAGDNQLDTDDEIAMEMESEYLDITNGSGTMAWLKRYKMHPDRVADIFAEYGLAIHRYKMKDEDCQLVAESLSHCRELKKFSLTHSEDLQPLFDKICRECGESALHATRVCFAGYNRVDETLSRLFVKYVALFKAEGLILTSVKVSHEGLQYLKNDLKRFIQAGHFKSLEIFRNPCIGDLGWESLANIAKDFSEVGRPLNLATCYCDVEDERLLTFKNALQGAKLGKIDICGSRKLTERGFQTLGEIVNISKCPLVTLQDCDLDVTKVKSFNSGCGIASSEHDEMMQSLNIADNPNLGADGIAEIKKTICRFGVKSLNIGCCRLDRVDFDHSFENLDVSGNPRCIGIPELAKTVTDRLYLRNCKLSKCDLEKLASKLGTNEQKLKALDISEDSKQMDYDNVDFLVELFKDVTESITVAENFTIATSEVIINGTT